jgi:hypothetical protein
MVLEFLRNRKIQQIGKDEGMAEQKTRKTRSDCTVGTFEKKHGLPAGSIRNKDGRDTRSDKKIGTLRKESEKN